MYIKIICNGGRGKELTKGLMTFVIKDFKLISTVESERFREFMHIAILNMLYDVEFCI